MRRLVDLPAGHPGWDEALPVLRELRTGLDAQRLAEVLATTTAQPPSFTAVFDDEQGCLAVAGWRIVANTSVGRKLYVDDLVTTSAARSQAVAAELLGALEQRARDNDCSLLELDSGVQRHRAHRFYLRERMDITAFHFAKTL